MNSNISRLSIYPVLTSKIELFVNEAENLFGKRSGNYKIELNINSDQDYPSITIYPNSSKIETIYINLCNETYFNLIENYWLRFNYQSSHEIIHSLMPCELEYSTYLEEGLAEYFALKQIKKINGLYWHDQHLKSTKENNYKYYEAYCLFIKFFNNPEIQVKQLRNHNPFFSQLVVNDILIINNNLDLIEKLLTKFN